MFKKRFSTEYNMLAILEYLYSNSNSNDVSVSKYHIMNKVPELKQQRQDRISFILSTLEEKGLIVPTVTPNATFYRITEKGRVTYLKWVSEFLKFYRIIRDYG
ncbi:MAG: PadR family transcriptional regulator [Nitrososphaeraceae archaeon]